MHQDEIVRLAQMAESNPKLLIKIRQGIHESHYLVRGFIEVMVDGKWKVHVEYQCNSTQNKYALRIDEFKDFH